MLKTSLRKLHIPNDLLFVYLVRNHPDVRKWMRNTKPFTFNQHMKFWETELKNKDNWRIITASGFDVGYINWKNGEYSIAILKDYRNQGIGTEAIRLFAKIRRGKATIKKNNLASKKAFAKGLVDKSIIATGSDSSIPVKSGKSLGEREHSGKSKPAKSDLVSFETSWGKVYFNPKKDADMRHIHEMSHKLHIGSGTQMKWNKKKVK